MKRDASVLSMLAVLSLLGCGAAGSDPLPVAFEPPEGTDPTDPVDPPDLPVGAFVVVDTGQDTCFSDTSAITAPSAGQPFAGQDAQYAGNQSSYQDNGDGTVTDQATGLMWLQDDSGSFSIGDAADGKLDWKQALAWAEGLTYAGHSDWRLPNAKELQGIVDYTRSPDTTSSAAIDPVLRCTAITAEDGSPNYGWYWTSTTHMDGPQAAVQACYVCFGEAFGYMFGQWLDVHGAGCQRSDPKSGDPAAYPTGRGPQGDAIRIYNFVRPVRDAD